MADLNALAALMPRPTPPQEIQQLDLGKLLTSAANFQMAGAHAGLYSLEAAKQARMLSGLDKYGQTGNLMDLAVASPEAANQLSQVNEHLAATSAPRPSGTGIGGMQLYSVPGGPTGRMYLDPYRNQLVPVGTGESAMPSYWNPTAPFEDSYSTPRYPAPSTGLLPTAGKEPPVMPKPDVAAGPQPVTDKSTTRVTPGGRPGAGLPEPEPVSSPIAPLDSKLMVDDPGKMLVTPDPAKSIVFDPTVMQKYPARLMEGAQAGARQQRTAMQKQTAAADTMVQRLGSVRQDQDVIERWVDSIGGNGALQTKFPDMYRLLVNPGSIAPETRQGIINAWASTPNSKAPQDVVAAINEWSKETTLIGFGNFQLTGLGARETQPMIERSIAATPNFGQPLQSSRLILSVNNQVAQAMKDQIAFFDRYTQIHGGVADGWREAFLAQNPPEKYLARAHYDIMPAAAREKLPGAVDQLRGLRDDVLKIEKGGDSASSLDARARFNYAREEFNKKYGGLANYFMFGRI